MFFRWSSLAFAMIGTGCFAADGPPWDECIARPTRDCVLELTLAEAEKGNSAYFQSTYIGEILSKREDGKVRLERILAASTEPDARFEDGFAKGLVDQERYDEAFAFLTSSPAGAEARFRLIEIFISRGDLVRAEALADAALPYRDSLRSKALVAKAYQAAGDLEKGSLLYLLEVQKAYTDRAENLPENQCFAAVYSAGIVHSGFEPIPAFDGAATALSIENTSDRARALSRSVSCLIEAGQFRAAAKIANLFDDIDEKNLALSHVSIASFDSGDNEGGLRFADMIPKGESAWIVAFSHIAEGLAEQGNFEEAERMIALTERDYLNHRARFRLAATYLEAGNVDAARRIASVAWEDIQARAEEDAFSAAIDMEGLHLVEDIIPREAVNEVLDTILQVQRAADQLSEFEVSLLPPVLGRWERAGEALEIIQIASDDKYKAVDLARLLEEMTNAGLE